jgi:transcriptional regulator with XRE-family HTH domain
MIKNRRQYKITKAAAAKFAQSLQQLESGAVVPVPGMDPEIQRAEREALKSQLDDLHDQLREYEELAGGNVSVLEVGSLADLPQALVRARISSGMSQKQLAGLLGIKEQQIQRYEAADYKQASLSRLLEIANVLGVNVRSDLVPKEPLEVMKTAFILMPFGEEFEAAYRSFVKEALEEAGFSASRADDILSHRNIMQDVVSSIAGADLVLADLTGSNPNVFYELGIAHALEKPTILLTQSVEELPFDLRSYRVLHYQTHFAKIEHAKQELVRLAANARTGAALFGNPVTDFLAKHPERVEEMNVTPSSKEADVPRVLVDDRGYVDYLIDIQEGYGELAKLLERVTEASKEITPQTVELASGITRAKETGGQLAASQIRFMCQRYSASLDVYAAELKAINDEYELIQNKTQDSLESLVRFHTTVRSDASSLQSFMSSMKAARASAATARDAFAGARDSTDSILNFERSLGRSGSAARSELDRLVSNISRTIASMDRAVDVAGGGAAGPLALPLPNQSRS